MVLGKDDLNEAVKTQEFGWVRGVSVPRPLHALLKEQRSQLSSLTKEVLACLLKDLCS